MKKKEIIYVAIGLVAIISVFLIIRRVRDRKRNSLESFIPGSSSNATKVTKFKQIECDTNTVLKRWDECNRINYAQGQINRVADKLGIPELERDGKFGAKTENAVNKLLGKKTATYNEIVAAVVNLL